jgi:integrase
LVEGPIFKSIQMKHQIKAINCHGDIRGRWYVEYYADNTRHRVYGGINKEKDLAKRTQLLEELLNSTIQQFAVNTIKKGDFITQTNESITFYMNEYLREKKQVLEPKTVKLYKLYLGCFFNFLKTKQLQNNAPNKITKQIVYEFRAYKSRQLKNRSVNNYIDCIKGFFAHIIKRYDYVLIKNPCENLVKLQNKSENHVAYSQQQAIEISKFLSANDIQMLNFCRFVGYGFLRCKETRYLKISDINFDNKTITLPASSIKSKVRTVKPMLNSFFELVEKMDIKNYPNHYYVFSPGGTPGLKIASDSYFRKKFKRVKDHFKFSNLHTIYSFRHTMVCDLLGSGASWHEIMKYTGHTTFSAFEKYARSIMNKPAEDLSDKINIKF